jgi:hypothetical protein
LESNVSQLKAAPSPDTGTAKFAAEPKLAGGPKLPPRDHCPNLRCAAGFCPYGRPSAGAMGADDGWFTQRLHAAMARPACAQADWRRSSTRSGRPCVLFLLCLAASHGASQPHAMAAGGACGAASGDGAPRKSAGPGCRCGPGCGSGPRRRAGAHYRSSPSRRAGCADCSACRPAGRRRAESDHKPHDSSRGSSCAAIDGPTPSGRHPYTARRARAQARDRGTCYSSGCRGAAGRRR